MLKIVIFVEDIYADNPTATEPGVKPFVLFCKSPLTEHKSVHPVNLLPVAISYRLVLVVCICFAILSDSKITGISFSKNIFLSGKLNVDYLFSFSLQSHIYSYSHFLASSIFIRDISSKKFILYMILKVHNVT